MTNATLIRTATSAALVVMTLLGRSTPVTAADPGRVAPAVQILGDKAGQFIPLGVSKSIVVDLPGDIKDVTTKYGKDLGLELAEQTLESKDQNKLILTDDTKTNGLFTITDALVDKSIATMKLGGIDISKDKLFDLSLIKEIYSENPDLKTSPS